MAARRPICCLLLLASLLPLTGMAQELYRYVDDNGVTVLSRQGVPSELIGKGYEVLNEHGRVVRVVPPAPSAGELARLQALKARAANDQKLLKLYSGPQDVDRARDRKLAEIDGIISVARGNLQSVRTQQANLQAQAADLERASHPVPEDLVTQIRRLDDEQQRLQRDIARHEQGRAEAEDAFALERGRLIELFGGP